MKEKVESATAFNFPDPPVEGNVFPRTCPKRRKGPGSVPATKGCIRERHHCLQT